MITYTANGSLIKNKVIEGMADNELEMDGHLSVSGTIKANQFMTADGKTISLEETHKKIKEIKDTHVTLDAHNQLKNNLLKADEGLAKKSDLESLQQEVTQLKNSNVSNEEVKELRTKLDNVKNSNLGPRQIVGTGNEKLVIGNMGYKNWSGIGNAKLNSDPNKFKHNYALVQHNNGTTSINSSKGKALQFRQADSIKMAIAPNGHVGIGTDKPDTRNGWDKVLEVQGGPHAKTLVTTRNNKVKMGTYAHQNWGGPSGSVGTESNHDLRLLTNYNEKMRIKTNGDVGIGTNDPKTKLHVHFQNEGLNPQKDHVAVFSADYDSSVKIQGKGGESYLEIANHHNETGNVNNSWGIGTNDDSKLHISYGANGTMNKSDKMVIHNNGNVDVNGTLNVNGSMNLKKGQKLSFQNSEADNDPYYFQKVGNTDSNYLKLTINDNNNESFQIWGDSCGSGGCEGDGVMKHKFDSSGNANHVGTITANKLCIGNTCFTENDMKKLPPPDNNKFKVEYYVRNGNNTLGSLIKTEYSSTPINYNWSSSTVGSSGRSDNVIIRYSGYLKFPKSGFFHFRIGSDDGRRFAFNGQIILYNWADQGYNEQNSTSIGVIKDHKYPFVFDFYEHGGAARVTLKWNVNDSYEIIPISAFSSP